MICQEVETHPKYQDHKHCTEGKTQESFVQEIKGKGNRSLPEEQIGEKGNIWLEKSLCNSSSCEIIASEEETDLIVEKA